MATLNQDWGRGANEIVQIKAPVDKLDNVYFDPELNQPIPYHFAMSDAGTTEALPDVDHKHRETEFKGLMVTICKYSAAFILLIVVLLLIRR